MADVPYATAKFRKASAACEKPLRVVGLQSPDSAYLWIADPKATWWHLAMAGAKPAKVKGASVKLSGLAAGTYRAEWWDTWKGRVLGRAEAKTAAGALRLDVPAFARDIACKVTPAAR